MEEIKTIKDLIAVLEKVEDKDIGVVLEGCDCTGNWNGKIEIYDALVGGKKLLLKRD